MRNGQLDRNRWKGFTLVEIMIVVAIIGLLAALAIPSFMSSRTKTQQELCISNLRRIEMSKERWALETGKSNGDAPVTSEIDIYIKGGNSPVCPVNGTYSYNAVGVNASCTISTPRSHQLPN